MTLLGAAALLLLAPAPAKEWSKAHRVGMIVPSGWVIVRRDDGRRAFVIDGPKLGPGRPRVVLWDAGPARTKLADAAAELARGIAGRAGWRLTTEKAGRLGACPCRRLGFSFTSEGGGKGRARCTVVLLGGGFCVLEMSAALTHFPGAVYDRMERSLEVRREGHTLGEGIGACRVSVPHGWIVRAQGGDAWSIDGPTCGVGRTAVLLRRGAPSGAKGTAPGTTVGFLGRERPATIFERIVENRRPVRMLEVGAEGWTAVAMLPVEIWDDLFPIVEELLRGAELVPAAEEEAPPGR